jgi:PRMT5 arginine-N-methyltransferase/PRMT5 TIM barrel domain
LPATSQQQVHQALQDTRGQCAHHAHAVQAVAALLAGLSCMHAWVRLPLHDDSDHDDAVWRWWDGLRVLCRHHTLLGIAAEVRGEALAGAMAARWVAEPLRCLLVPAGGFVANRRGYPVLPASTKQLVSDAMASGMQVRPLTKRLFELALLSAPLPQGLRMEVFWPCCACAIARAVVTGTVQEAIFLGSLTLARSQIMISTDGSVKDVHDFAAAAPAADAGAGAAVQQRAAAAWRLHVEYLSFLCQSLSPVEGLEALEFGYRDHVQLPLQPLADNLESGTYETFERDAPKYARYAEALTAALRDLSLKRRAAPSVAEASDGCTSSAKPVLQPVRVVVVGAGRGPLVDAALKAADEVGVPVAVTAVEKNPNAVMVLRTRLREVVAWRGRVDVVARDMRHWRPETLADIMERPLPACHTAPLSTACRMMCATL